MRNWRLSNRPIICEDESIEGFIVRIAQKNGYEEIDTTYKALYHFKPVLNDIRKSKKFNYKDYIYYELAEELTGQLITNRVYNRKYLSSKEYYQAMETGPTPQ